MLALEPSAAMADVARVNCLRYPLVEIEQIDFGLAAPELDADFPMHPASEPTDLAGDWHAEIEASDGFVEPRVRKHPWSATWSTSTSSSMRPMASFCWSCPPRQAQQT